MIFDDISSCIIDFADNMMHHISAILWFLAISSYVSSYRLLHYSNQRSVEHSSLNYQLNYIYKDTYALKSSYLDDNDRLYHRSTFRSIAVVLSSFLLLNTPISIHNAVADSRLNAPSSAGTRVNSDPESLLRYGLPISNKEIRDIQKSIESAKINIKTRRVGFAESDIKSAKDSLTKNANKLLSAVPSNHRKEAEESLNRMQLDMTPLIDALQIEQKAGSGSVQERKGMEMLIIMMCSSADCSLSQLSSVILLYSLPW